MRLSKGQVRILRTKEGRFRITLPRALAENTAELAAILAQYGSRDLPPEMVTRLRAIEGSCRSWRTSARSRRLPQRRTGR